MSGDKPMKKTLMIVLAVVALGAVAFAQDPTGGGGAGGGGRRGGGAGGGQFRMGGMRGNDVSGLSLLRMKEVQAELKLDAAQVEKLDALSTEMNDKMRAGFQPGGNGGGGGAPDPEAMKKRMEEMTAMQEDAKKKVATILNADQNKRLSELKIQRAGNEAILQADVQEALGLSAGQKSKAKLAQREQQDAMQGMFRPGGGGAGGGGGQVDRQAMMQEMQRQREEYLKKLGEILNADQAAKLKAMGGTPFKFPAPQQGQGRRNGGGGGGGF